MTLRLELIFCYLLGIHKTDCVFSYLFDPRGLMLQSKATTKQIFNEKYCSKLKWWLIKLQLIKKN